MKKTSIKEIKKILRNWGFSRREARIWVKTQRKQAKLEQENHEIPSK